MKKERGNSCAVCGAPIRKDLDMCAVCSRDTTTRTAMVTCVACGAINTPNNKSCDECGAPMGASKPPPNGEEESLQSADEKNPIIYSRKAELQVLEDCVEVCLEKKRVGGAVVAGDPGIGVSTLLKQLAYRLSERYPREQIFHVVGTGIEGPFWVLPKVLKQFFKIENDMDPASQRTRLSEKVAEVLQDNSAAEITQITHLLGHVAGIQFPGSPLLTSLQSDPKLMAKRLKEGLTLALEAVLKQNPAICIFDSVIEGPNEILPFALDLLNSLDSVPLCVITAVKKENFGQFKNSVVRLNLEPLSDDVMYRLFSEFMPLLRNPPPELIEAAVTRAAGNPGALSDLCALLIESEVISRSGKEWTADLGKLSIADIPLDIKDVSNARVNQLEPFDRLVLANAAVFGDVFWDEAIVAMTRSQEGIKNDSDAAEIWNDDSDTLKVFSSLDRLVERKFVAQLPDKDIRNSVKYAFTRSGIREAVMQSMEAEEIRDRHIIAAEWLSHTGAGRIPLISELEGEHWALAEKNHRSSLAFFRAARLARRQYHNQKAIKLFQKGLKLSDHSDKLAVADAYHDLGSVFDLLGQSDDAEHCFTQMLENAWVLAHRSKAGAAFNRIGRLYRARGDGAAARAFLNRGMALFKAADDKRGMAASLADLGDLARRQSSYERAFLLVNQALEIQRKHGSRRSIAVCLHSLGHIEAARASYARAERYLTQALEIQRQQNDRGGMAQTLSTLAMIMANKGEMPKAIKRWNAALEMAREVGDRRMQALLHNSLGEAFSEQRQIEEALKHFKTCEKMAAVLDDQLLLSQVLRNVGVVTQKKGDVQEARNHLEKALELATELEGKEMLGLTYRAIGELDSSTVWDTSKAEIEDTAELSFQKALKIFKSIGNEFEVARTQHALGNRMLERGDISGGKEMLEKAMEIFVRLESKMGEAIGRTIKEISGQANPAKAKDKVTAKNNRRKSNRKVINTASRDAADTVPDLTAELEDIVE